MVDSTDKHLHTQTKTLWERDENSTEDKNKLSNKRFNKRTPLVNLIFNYIHIYFFENKKGRKKIFFL